jgi:hypothetical protein
MDKLNLNNITCVIVDGYWPANKNARVLNYCADLCDFHSVKLLSFEQPTIDYSYDFIKIPKLNYLEYSAFAIKELPKYIESDYALVLNHDGYIVDTKYWDNNFLNYDYIGAPWHAGTLPNARVGNGGFSLRSKKLLDRCMKDDFVLYPTNDDIMICSIYKELIEADGLKFAPVDIAAKFSYGGPVPEVNREWTECFGAHIGKPNYDFEKPMCESFVKLVFKDC